MTSPKTGRRDHYLPQGYLRGFIDPARQNEPRPLWRFDIAHKTWAMRSTKEVAHRTGFYDYAGEGPELEALEPADKAFLELENQFPYVRSRLLALKGFKNWHKHLGFLLRFMQMIRARSPLFFEQKEEEGKALQTLVVEKVHPDGKTLTLPSMTPSPPPAAFIKNRAITDMRGEIQQGSAWMENFNWALRYCESVAAPFVTNEAPLVVEGPSVNIEEGIAHPDSLLYFPLCWQACLFGSLRRFDKGTDKLGPEHMREFRVKYRNYAQTFLLSPTRLDDL